MVFPSAYVSEKEVVDFCQSCRASLWKRSKRGNLFLFCRFRKLPCFEVKRLCEEEQRTGEFDWDEFTLVDEIIYELERGIEVIKDDI